MPSFLAGIPPATLFILGANIALFLLMAIFRLPQVLLLNYATAIPVEIIHGQVWRLATYMFLHAGAGHIFFNMLTLYFFAPMLERDMGTRRFLRFYLLCGLGAGLFHTLVSMLRGPEAAAIRMLGASGALYGVLCACAFYYPNQIVYVNFLIPLKMKYFALIFGALAFFGSIGESGGGISHITHLGGLLTALVLLFGPRWINRLRNSGRGGRPRGGREGGGPREDRRPTYGPGRSADIYDDPHWRLDQ